MNKNFEYKKTPVILHNNGDLIEMNVAYRISANACKDFCQIVVNEVFNDGYQPWMVSAACDYAAIKQYTDLDLGELTHDEVYDLINTTDIGQLIESTADIEQLADVKVSARKLVDYYANAAANRNDTLGKLNELLDKIAEFINKVLAIDINPDDIRKIASAVGKIEFVDNNAIIDFVTRNIKE